MQEHIFSTYAKPDTLFVRGEGVRLFDAQGADYIDLTAGIAVTALGHAHPHLVAALTEQAGRLWHLSNVFRIDGQERLADRLCAATFADRVFFTNSGAEAMECAIKTARRYHWSKGAPERIDILTFEGAFHGRTLATIAAGGQAKYLEGFGPKTPGFTQLPFDNIAAVRAAIGDQTAAILIEPVQGEGGVRPAPWSFLRELRALCDEHGLLLIYDEIQTGMGRTGKLFAHEWSGAVPDIMAVAKGLGGGFPVGACLATEEAASGMTVGSHGTTFGGNPLAMAVGNAVLDVVMGDGFLDHVREMAKVLRQHLAELADSYPDLVDGVRGEGLLQGLKARIPNTDIIAAMREERVLAIGAGDNVVRFAPPLVITADELREARGRMDAALSRLAARPARAASGG
ncbi:MAG: acetylornithine aminotransferase [Alphaproteobacteria bacterium]|nr:MAG: acetylornithine aminotransferase [Alphaproteobacteria bacterium]